MDRYDAIVIGAGVDGLVAATYLARAGTRVLVLEKSETVGGGAVSQKRKSGAILSSEAFAEPRLDTQIAADLDLARYGYGIVPVQASYALAPGEPPLSLSADDRAMASALEARSPRDAERFFELRSLVKRAMQAGEPALLSPLPLLQTRRGLSVKAALAAEAKLALRERAELSHFRTVSVGHLLDSMLETALLKAHLGARALFGLPHAPYAPFSARCLARHPLLGGDGTLGAYIRGGAGVLTGALTAALASFGGSVRTSASVVKVPPARNGRASVVLESGETIEARVVISSLGVGRTVRGLLAAETVPSSVFARAAPDMRPIQARLDLVLDAPPEFPALGEALAREPGDIVLLPSLAALDTAHESWLARKLPETLAIIVSLPSLIDPTRAAPGAHVLSALVHGVPERLSDGPWTNKRGADFAARVVHAITGVSPGIAQRVRELRLRLPGDGEAMRPLEEQASFALGREVGLKHLLVCGPNAQSAVFSGRGGKVAAREALSLLSRRRLLPWR